MEVVRPRTGCEDAVTTHATASQEPWMDIHDNARTTPRSRMLMIERLEAGWTVSAVAAALASTAGRCANGGTGLRRKGRPDWLTGRRGRIPVLPGLMVRPRPRSSGCAASGCPDRRSRAASADSSEGMAWYRWTRPTVPLSTVGLAGAGASASRIKRTLSLHVAAEADGPEQLSVHGHSARSSDARG